MNILTVVGARPQFIKAAVVSRAFKDAGVNETLVHTGQHYDRNMSDVFFEEMSIPKPNHHLKVGGSSHGAMTGQMLEKIEEILLLEKPNLVLVHGDTNSTLAGALAAAKMNIPVAHVEAGLRSFNMQMPEEVNRILTDRVSQLLFCPSSISVNHLKNEGICTANIFNSGDVMFDAVLYYLKSAEPSSFIKPYLEKDFKLSTVHRAENTNDPKRLSQIFSALVEVSQDQRVVLPLHPRTIKILKELKIETNGIDIIEPVGYFDMLLLLKHCSSVLTDSGGLQKEAYFLSKPCITMRDETEWVETVEQGCNFIVGADKEKIINVVNEIKSKKFNFDKPLYGTGKAGEFIVDKIKSF